ncbi:MAG: hypothetical protein ABI346_07710 [Candidatus Baltobacteraceae bacterium]
MSTRLLLASVLASLLVGSAVPTDAAVPPMGDAGAAPRQVSDGDDKAEPKPDKDDREQNAGVVEGHVVSVNYQSGIIGLQTAGRGRVNVLVLPSTNIQGKGDGFHTIADISRGSHLRVFLSRKAHQLIAQIIRLK